MMTRYQYLLTKLAEECCEVAQIALKTQQFGANEVLTGQPLTNQQRVHRELHDIMASIAMLNEVGFDYRPDDAAIARKQSAVEYYLDKSRALGMVGE